MLLAIDTASQFMSLALHDGRQIGYEATWRSRNNHTVELAPAIRAALASAGQALGDLSAIAVAQGPGSFTGLRIGLGVAKGLAQARGLPLVAIPTLEIVAAGVPPLGSRLIAVLQVGRGRLCAQPFTWAGAGWTGDGDDSMSGSNGNDTMTGDAGIDQLFGNAGDDTQTGGTGNDVLQGGGSDDVVSGDSGNDVILGQDGNDTLHGGTGNDQVEGGAGTDVATGDDNEDVLRGDDGNDELRGGNGNDVVFGDAQNDKLFGDAGIDRLYGGSGNDRLSGGTGSDGCFGDSGTDVGDASCESRLGIP